MSSWVIVRGEPFGGVAGSGLCIRWWRGYVSSDASMSSWVIVWGEPASALPALGCVLGGGEGM